jgi:hypothetical protein
VNSNPRLISILLKAYEISMKLAHTVGFALISVASAVGYGPFDSPGLMITESKFSDNVVHFNDKLLHRKAAKFMKKGPLRHAIKKKLVSIVDGYLLIKVDETSERENMNFKDRRIKKKQLIHLFGREADNSEGIGQPGTGTPGTGTPGFGTPGSGGEPGSGTPGIGTPGIGTPGSGTPGNANPEEPGNASESAPPMSVSAPEPISSIPVPVAISSTVSGDCNSARLGGSFFGVCAVAIALIL